MWPLAHDVVLYLTVDVVVVGGVVVGVVVVGAVVGVGVGDGGVHGVVVVGGAPIACCRWLLDRQVQQPLARKGCCRGLRCGGGGVHQCVVQVED